MGNENKSEERGIASEIFGELKNTIKFQWILIGVLIFLLAATNIYHIYQWSQFDTIVVDSGEGGYANYIGNDGDINYGESSSSQEEDQR